MKKLYVLNFGDLAKALKEVDFPAYTRKDGTYVPAHRQRVQVSSHSKEDVLSGQGTPLQREAHRRLHRNPSFRHEPEVHQRAAILELSTRLHIARNDAAALTHWRSRALAGQNPTPAQWAAFQRLPEDKQRKALEKVRDQRNTIGHLRPPERVEQAESPPTSDARAPTSQPATPTEPTITNELEFGERHYAKVDGQWSFAHNGAWHPVRDHNMRGRLDAGQDPRVQSQPDDAGASGGAEDSGSLFERRIAEHGLTVSMLRTDRRRSKSLMVQRSGNGPAAVVAQDGNSFRLQRGSGDQEIDGAVQMVIGKFADEDNSARMHQAAQTSSREIYDASQGLVLDDSVRNTEVSQHAGDIGEMHGLLQDGRPYRGLLKLKPSTGNHRGKYDVLFKMSGMPEELVMRVDNANTMGFLAEMLMLDYPDRKLDFSRLAPHEGSQDRGPQEGDTKVENGVTYRLDGGRWHRVSPEEESQTELSLSDVAEHVRYLGGDRERNALELARYIDDYGASNSDSPAHRPVRLAAQAINHLVSTGRLDSSDGLRLRALQGPAAVDLLARVAKVGGEGSVNEHIDAFRAVMAEDTASAAPGETSTAVSVADDNHGIPEVSIEPMREALAAVPVPSGIANLSSSTTNQGVRRRIGQLLVLAQAGDIDGITNFSTSRTRANYALVDDYRTALLAAAHQSREVTEPAPVTAEIPPPPTITGANEANTALRAARRKVEALYQAAQSADPVAAILAIPTSRGNGYMNKADDYKSALLTHFGHSHDGPTGEVVTPPQATVAAATVPDADPIMDTQIAYNPDGKTVDQLGFVPRPNVPLTWTVKVNGIKHPEHGLIAYPDSRMQELARRYLEQPGVKQTQARHLQDDGPALPMHPQFAEILGREKQQAAKRQARAEEKRRAAMVRQRAAAAAVVDALASLPDLHKPKAVVGANIHSWEGHVKEAAAYFGVSEDVVKDLMGRLVVDYGGYLDGEPVRFVGKLHVSGGFLSVAFTAVNASGDVQTSPKSVRIHRSFEKDADGGYVVDHALFDVAKISVTKNGANVLVTNNNEGGKALFRTSLGAYKALGVKKIKVHANIDVGGYAWAKYGYTADQRSWNNVRERLKRQVFSSGSPKVDGRSLSPEANRRLRAVLDNPNVKSMWALSDFKDGEFEVGKKLLLGSSWLGSMDLGDNEGYRRCLKYIDPRRSMNE